MRWYALYVETGSEDSVQKFLQNKFSSEEIETYVPKKLISERKQGTDYTSVKTLFPGYVFIHTEINENTYYKIKKVPKVHYMVNSGLMKKDQSFSCYTVVPSSEIDYFINLTGKTALLEYSDIVINDNNQVIVISGPLLGLESIIKRLDKRKKRAKIEVTLMGVTRSIDVGINIISK